MPSNILSVNSCIHGPKLALAHNPSNMLFRTVGRWLSKQLRAFLLGFTASTRQASSFSSPAATQIGLRSVGSPVDRQSCSVCLSLPGHTLDGPPSPHSSGFSSGIRPGFFGFYVAYLPDPVRPVNRPIPAERHTGHLIPLRYDIAKFSLIILQSVRSSEPSRR